MGGRAYEVEDTPLGQSGVPFLPGGEYFAPHHLDDSNFDFQSIGFFMIFHDFQKNVILWNDPVIFRKQG